MADISKIVTPGGDEYNLKDATARAAAATMTGASSSADGSGGTVPAPVAGQQARFLRGDGTWAEVRVPNPPDMIGATASTDGVAGLVPAPEAGEQNKVLKGDGTWGDLGMVLTPASPISIPSTANSPISLNLEGLTANHVVVAWRFSDSAENFPPCKLTITTYDGYFTVSNTSGTTIETIQPVFAIPSAVATTTHNE